MKKTAVVVGGSLSDRADIVSALARVAVRVDLHVLTGEKLPARLPKETGLVVLHREKLDNKDFQAAYAAADKDRIPVVRWDRDWRRFSERLIKSGVIEQIEEGNVAQPIGPYDVVVSVVSQLDEQGFDPNLRAAVEMMIDALAKHRAYRGVSIKLEDSGAARVAFDPRSFLIRPGAVDTQPEHGPAYQPVQMARPQLVEAPPAPPKKKRHFSPEGLARLKAGIARRWDREAEKKGKPPGWRKKLEKAADKAPAGS